MLGIQVHIVLVYAFNKYVGLLVTFQVLSAMLMKMITFWDVAQYFLVDVSDVSDALAFSMTNVISHHSNGEAVSTSVTSANFYWTTRRNVSRESILPVHFFSLLISHLISCDYLN
jgi:hypothetical protein